MASIDVNTLAELEEDVDKSGYDEDGYNEDGNDVYEKK